MTLRTLSLTVVALLALPAIAHAAPDASFFLSPQSPRAGNEVQFVSTSCDPRGGPIEQAWDLDGDGAYDDATGPRTSRSYPTQSVVNVGIQVTDRRGTIDTRRRDLVVDSTYSLPAPDTQRLMSPFPLVRLAGETTARGARIDLLTVRGPVCAKASATCRGRGCRSKRATGVIGRGRLRFRSMERSLRAGARIEIRVRKGDLIGKLTRFQVRRGKPPARTDLCLVPGTSRGSRCPQD